MADGKPVGRTVRIVNVRGLHARAAAKLTALAEEFSCEISVSRNGEEVSARSIMGLLKLGAAKDAEIRISASGADAAPALEALCALVDSGFGEESEGTA